MSASDGQEFEILLRQEFVDKLIALGSLNVFLLAES